VIDFIILQSIKIYQNPAQLAGNMLSITGHNLHLTEVQHYSVLRLKLWIVGRS